MSFTSCGFRAGAGLFEKRDPGGFLTGAPGGAAGIELTTGKDAACTGAAAIVLDATGEGRPAAGGEASGSGGFGSGEVSPAGNGSSQWRLTRKPLGMPATTATATVATQVRTPDLA
jgi:hypothetical protein